MSSENQAFGGFISMQSAKNTDSFFFFFMKRSCAVLTPKEDRQCHLTACAGWYF